jgi:hypothetical protein
MPSTEPPQRPAIGPDRIPGGLRVGQVAHRDRRVVKNGRWYLVDAEGFQPVGWGDVSIEDLHSVHRDLGPSAFLVVQEHPTGSSAPGSPWRWYNGPDPTPGPSLRDVCDRSLVAVLAEGGPVFVDGLGTYAPGELVDMQGIRLRAISSGGLLQVCRGLIG